MIISGFIPIFIALGTIDSGPMYLIDISNTVSYALMPLSIITTLFPFQNYILNVFYFYLLGCIFAYPVVDQKKKWYPLTIGISFMVLIGILGIALGKSIYG